MAGIGAFLRDIGARVRGALVPVQRGQSPNTFLGAPSAAGLRVGQWFGLTDEPWPGAFQQGAHVTQQTILTHEAVYACMTLIAGDIAKLPMRLAELTADGIWLPTTSPAFSPVLRKPNRLQTQDQFIEAWVLSLMGIHGNAYILKERDARNVVVALYVLDASRVTPLVAPDGQVFYRVAADNLPGLPDEVTLPASEIIHDRVAPLFHPLVGISPLIAASPAARRALAIQSQSERFFAGGQRLTGILSVPAVIDQAQARTLSASFKSTYREVGSDGIAVLGNGAKYEPIVGSAREAQLVEQFGYTARSVCMAYHVPPHKIGAEPPPAYANGEQMQIAYYSEALQRRVRAIETLMDDGLGIGEGIKVEGRTIGVDIDVTELSRMDGVQQAEMLTKLTSGGVMAPNEARRRQSLPKVEGGDQPFLQQQNWPIRDLANRPAPEGMPAASAPPTAAQPAANDPVADIPDVAAREIVGMLMRSALERQEPRDVALTA